MCTVHATPSKPAFWLNEGPEILLPEPVNSLADNWSDLRLPEEFEIKSWHCAGACRLRQPWPRRWRWNCP